MFVFIVYCFLYLCIAPRNRLPRQMALYKFFIIIIIIIKFKIESMKLYFAIQYICFVRILLSQNNQHFFGKIM